MWRRRKKEWLLTCFLTFETSGHGGGRDYPVKWTGTWTIAGNRREVLSVVCRRTLAAKRVTRTISRPDAHNVHRPAYFSDSIPSINVTTKPLRCAGWILIFRDNLTVFNHHLVSLNSWTFIRSCSLLMPNFFGVAALNHFVTCLDIVYQTFGSHNVWFASTKKRIEFHCWRLGITAEREGKAGVIKLSVLYIIYFV